MDKEALASGYGTSQWVLGANLAGINEADSLKQPVLAGNCINWIAGHILACRGQVLQLLGEKPFLSAEETKLYMQGSAPLKPGDKCVSIAGLREGLEKTSGTIVAKLKALKDPELEELLDPSLIPIPLEKPSRAAFLTLLLFHEGYHTGQAGLSRRLLGKEAGLK